MHKKKFISWYLGVFVSIFSYSNSSAQDSLTIEQAIATALQNNFDIKLSRNDSLIAAINFSYRNAAFLPQINATGTVLANNNNQKQTYTDNSVKTRKGVRTTNANAALSANWLLFDGLRMFITREKLEELLQLGSYTIQNQISNTVSDVIKTYYDIVYQKQLLRSTEEQMAFSSDRLRLAQYKFDVGVGIKPDVLQAQIDLNQQRAAQINQMAALDQRKQTLNRLMNVPQNLDYKVSDTIPVRTDLTIGDLLNNITNTSPELLLARKNIDVSRLGVREARADLFPNISFTTAYNFARTNNNSVLNPIAQPLLNVNHGFNYGLTASIPILNNFRVRQSIKQAELTVNYQQLVLQNQQSLVTTNVLNAYKTYDAQKRIVGISDSNVTLARENLFIEQERYRVGNTTFIELRQAEENVANALTTLITARYNLKVAETELLRLKGELVRRQ
jgi:outer membrane protein TolC